MRKSLGIIFMLSLLLLSSCAKKADGKASDAVSGVQSGLRMDDFAQKYGLNEPVVPESESKDITVVLSGTDCEALLDFFCAVYLEPEEDPMPIEEFQYLLGETSFFLPWILGGCRDGDIGWSEIADMQAAAQEEISVLLAAEDGQKLYKSY